MDRVSHLQNRFGQNYRPVPSTRCDGYPQPMCGCLQPPHGYRLPALSEKGFLGPWIFRRTILTHVENLKDPGKVLLPNGNLVLIALGEDESKGCISFTLLGHPPLDAHQSSAIERSISRWFDTRIDGDSRGQISNRIEDGLGESF